MRSVSFAVTFAVAFGVLAATRDASAFCRSTTCRTTAARECQTDDDGCPIDGAKLFWTSSCISYAMNENGTQRLDPDETRAVIRKTFQAWTEVPCPGGGRASMTFQERDPVSCKMSQYNKDGKNLNVILFQDDDWQYRGIDDTLAKTSVTYNDQTGEIYDADIEVNAANNPVTITDDPKKVKYDLQAILTHEVGHFIGIAHSPKESAVMYASYSAGSTAQRKLTDDDVDAVCAIYPPNDGVPCDVEPHGGFTDSCGTTKKSGVCAVSSIGAPGGADDLGTGTPAHGAAASLALLGIGALATVRRRWTAGGPRRTG